MIIMGFSEKTKLEVKKKANFQCCMCRGFIVDVHHIIPTNENGPDTIHSDLTPKKIYAKWSYVLQKT
jgi:hypothetical protein